MKRLFSGVTAAALSALLLSFGASGVASAASYAYADCSLQTNLCAGYGGSDSGPVRLMWSFEGNGIDPIFPDCTDQNICTFWCRRYPGPLVARLYVYDTSFNLLAVSDPAPGYCSQQDELLP